MTIRLATWVVFLFPLAFQSTTCAQDISDKNDAVSVEYYRILGSPQSVDAPIRPIGEVYLEKAGKKWATQIWEPSNYSLNCAIGFDGQRYWSVEVDRASGELKRQTCKLLDEVHFHLRSASPIHSFLWLTNSDTVKAGMKKDGMRIPTERCQEALDKYLITYTGRLWKTPPFSQRGLDLFAYLPEIKDPFAAPTPSAKRPRSRRAKQHPWIFAALFEPGTDRMLGLIVSYSGSYSGAWDYALPLGHCLIRQDDLVKSEAIFSAETYAADTMLKRKK